MDKDIRRVLCCECGTITIPNKLNMCDICIKSSLDITKGIKKDIIINFCRSCDRYLNPPNSWIACKLESKELLSLCLKKVNFENKRIIDAFFLWSEPHSRRIKIKVTVQDMVYGGIIVKQSFQLDGTLVNQQCGDCTKIMAKNTWNTLVQIRQKVKHKKTFLYLEQCILKYNAEKDCVNIKERNNGLDFYYLSLKQAGKLVNFITELIPVKVKKSEQLISVDTHSNKSTYKFTYSVEIIDICKDDLIYLSDELSKQIGGISRLQLCLRVRNQITLLDPTKLNIKNFLPKYFWKQNSYKIITTIKNLEEYYVVDCEEIEEGKKVTVIDAKTLNYQRRIETLTHLKYKIEPGDYLLGYPIYKENYSNIAPGIDEFNLEIIIVKKSFKQSKAERKSKRRWRLKHLQKQVEDNTDKKSDGHDSNYEEFLNEIEEDEEMLEDIDVYVESEDGAMKKITEDELLKEIVKLKI